MAEDSNLYDDYTGSESDNMHDGMTEKSWNARYKGTSLNIQGPDIDEEEEEEELDVANDYLDSQTTRVSEMQTLTDTPMGNLGIGESKWDFRKPPTIDEGLDIQETRGQRQSSGEKWRYGVTKAIGKIGTNVIGGTAGIVYGLFDAMMEGDWSNMWNNSVAHTLDDWNEAMDKKLPNYYTQAERDATFWGKLGTANFWSDSALNGASFLFGAALTEFTWLGLTALTGGIAAPGLAMATAGNAARLARWAKKIDRAADATKIYKGIKNVANSKKLFQTTRVGRQLLTGTSYEAGVESRAHYDRVKEFATQKMHEKIMKEEGLKVPRELTTGELEDIENTSKDSANAVFIANMALVGAINM